MSNTLLIVAVVSLIVVVVLQVVILFRKVEIDLSPVERAFQGLEKTHERADRTIHDEIAKVHEELARTHKGVEGSLSGLLAAMRETVEQRLDMLQEAKLTSIQEDNATQAEETPQTIAASRTDEPLPILPKDATSLVSRHGAVQAASRPVKVRAGSGNEPLLISSGEDLPRIISEHVATQESQSVENQSALGEGSPTNRTERGEAALELVPCGRCGQSVQRGGMTCWHGALYCRQCTHETMSGRPLGSTRVTEPVQFNSTTDSKADESNVTPTRNTREGAASRRARCNLAMRKWQEASVREVLTFPQRDAAEVTGALFDKLDLYSAPQLIDIAQNAIADRVRKTASEVLRIRTGVLRMRTRRQLDAGNVAAIIRFEADAVATVSDEHLRVKLEALDSDALRCISRNAAVPQLRDTATHLLHDGEPRRARRQQYSSMTSDALSALIAEGVTDATIAEPILIEKLETEYASLDESTLRIKSRDRQAPLHAKAAQNVLNHRPSRIRMGDKLDWWREW